MHTSVSEMDALCITHVPKSVSLVDELQLLNKRRKPLSLSVYKSNCRSPYLLQKYSSAMYYSAL